jgi:hypothetical protein
LWAAMQGSQTALVAAVRPAQSTLSWWM